jgi:PAS domain S-box-containing protein
MGEVIKTSLQQLGEFLRLDRLVLVEFSRDGQELEVTYSWEVPGAELTPRVITRQDFPWAMRRLLGEQNVVFGCLDELPAEAAYDRDSFQRLGARSNLVIPLVAGGRVLGALAFVTVTAERTWPDELMHRLRLIAEVFANALARKEAEDALRASEVMKSAILASLTSSVTVLDRQGRIVTVNESWTRFARQHGMPSDGVGVNYREVLLQAIRPDTPHTAETLAGVEAVLDGLRPEFTSEYASRTADGERWFTLSAVPLGRSEGGAVLAHADITERKGAEMEAQRSRQELAHCTRVSTIGAMTVALAHELNQPLAGILANAQAAQRFLEATPPAFDEFGDILVDIVEDVKRAAEVIQHLRDLLQKNECQYIVLDLNELCRDVAKLVSSDAVIRNITVRLDVDPEPTMVYGDHVQLQQVVLNLLLNAMEAIAEGSGDERLIVVRTRNLDTGTVSVSVQDTGTGLQDDIQALVFEPFYTRKPAGLGMGLSIARLIIEAHGGVIGVTNNPTCGATFSFTLPCAGDASA